MVRLSECRSKGDLGGVLSRSLRNEGEAIFVLRKKGKRITEFAAKSVVC